MTEQTNNRAINLTVTEKVATKKPNVAPVVIFGSKAPTIPPTSAPTQMTTSAMTPNNFMFGSTENDEGYIISESQPLTKERININVQDQASYKESRDEVKRLQRTVNPNEGDSVKPINQKT